MRVTGDLYTSSGDALLEFMKYPYVRDLFIQFDPWVYFLLPAVGFALWRAHRKGDRRGIRDVWFLVWWVGSVFAFFAVTGNHAWYLLPIYVPAAMLVGRLIGGVVAGGHSARLLSLIGASGVGLFSVRLAGLSPVAIAPPSAGIPLDALTGGRGFLAILILGMVLVLTLAPTWSIIRRRIPPAWQPSVRVTLPTAMVLILVLAMVGAPPVLWWTGDEHQRQIAAAIDREVPAGATVYFDETVAVQPHYSLAYYTERSLDVTSVTDVSRSDHIRYALLRGPTLDGLDRDYRVLYRGQLNYFDRVQFELVLVSLEPT